MIYRLMAVLFSCVFLTIASATSTSASSAVVINEVQTTGCREYQLANPNKCAVEDGSQEFVELYNASTVDIDVTDWRIEYLTAAHTGGITPTKVVATLSGKIMASSHVLVSFKDYINNADSYFGSVSSSGYLAKSGGHVRLVNGEDLVIDLLSWGTATPLVGWPKIAEISAGSSAKRLALTDPIYTPSMPFVNSLTITPEAGGLQPWHCEGVVLSEIAPNPKGTDTAHEFIEVYNPTAEAVPLRGCSLRLNESGAAFAFTDQVINAGQYLAVSDVESGITLPNSAGATVWLLSTESEQSVQYPADMPEGTSWASISSTWQSTASLTANQANILGQLTEGGKGGKVSSTPASCPAGKYRSPITIRCRKTQSIPTTLKACRADQERNFETNRCRSKTTIAASLAACKVGQTRNPATNRCRATASSTSTVLKACQEGQERNPDTNRCRKVVNSESKANYKVEQTPTPPKAPLGWIIAGTVGVGVLSYGIYEWRREIGEFLGKLKAKVSGGPTP